MPKTNGNNSGGMDEQQAVRQAGGGPVVFSRFTFCFHKTIPPLKKAVENSSRFSSFHFFVSAKQICPQNIKKCIAHSSLVTPSLITLHFPL